MSKLLSPAPSPHVRQASLTILSKKNQNFISPDRSPCTVCCWPIVVQEGKQVCVSARLRCQVHSLKVATIVAVYGRSRSAWLSQGERVASSSKARHLQPTVAIRQLHLGTMSMDAQYMHALLPFYCISSHLILHPYSQPSQADWMALLESVNCKIRP